MVKACLDETYRPLVENSYVTGLCKDGTLDFALKMVLPDAIESVFTIPMTQVPVVSLYSFQYVLHTSSRLNICRFYYYLYIISIYVDFCLCLLN